MKRFFKSMLSLLIVAIMVAQVLPLQLLVTETEAASMPTYRYEAVTTGLQPGKSYLIVNSASVGTASAVMVPNGAIEGDAVSVGNVAILDDNGTKYIADNGSLANYEWSVVNGMTFANYLPSTYMLQNTGTGAWLYNPAYYTGDYTLNMTVTFDPLHDIESPYVSQIYNSSAALAYLNAKDGGTYEMSNSWVTIGATGNNDPKVYLFKFEADDPNALSSATYPHAALTMHSVANNQIQFYVNETPSLMKNSQQNFTLTKNAWLSYQFPDDTRIPLVTRPDKWLHFRIDTNPNDKVYVGSLVFSRNSHAHNVFLALRNSISRWGGSYSGFQPSVRFPFCQFVVSTGSLNKVVGSYDTKNSAATTDGTVGYNTQYFYGWENGMFKAFFRQGTNVTYPSNTYFFEKVLVSEGSYTWQKVTSANDIVPGGEYVICNQSGATDNAVVFFENSTTNVTFQGRNNSTSYITPYPYNISADYKLIDRSTGATLSTEVADKATWIVRPVGNYFYLQNKYNGKILYYDNTVSSKTVGSTTINDAVTLKTMNQSATGGAMPYDIRYVWDYDFGGECLKAYNIAQNPNETETSKSIGYKTACLTAQLDNTCFLYKKTYCQHLDTENVAAVAPTCTKVGYTAGVKCKDCDGWVTEPQEIPAKKHDYVKTVVKEPNCTDSGVTTYTCSRNCNEDNYYYEEYPVALGHDYSSQVISPTCEEQGYTLKTCKRNCGLNGAQVKENYTAATGHNYTSVVTPPTCTAQGYTTYTCQNDNTHTYVDNYVDTVPHSWNITGYTGICGEGGKVNKECTVCHTTTTEDLVEHNYEVISEIQGSCEVTGEATYKCTFCGHEYTTSTPAPGHDMGEWYVVTPAQPGVDGVKRRDCKRGCGHFETDVIAATKLKGSEETAEPGDTVTIDFTLEGNPGIWAMNFVVYWPEALECVRINSSDEVFPLRGIEGNANQPVDPADNDVYRAYFNAAGVPVDEIAYSAFAYVVDNGSLENSYNDGKVISFTFKLPAENCLNEYDIKIFGVYANKGNDVINVEGEHIEGFPYVDGKITVPNGTACDHIGTLKEVIVKEPTCTTDGEKCIICTVCGETTYEVIPSDGHKMSDWKPYRPATGLSAEIERRTCSVCGWFEDRKKPDGATATGTGISDSINNEEYVYRWTTRLYPGREYMLIGRTEDQQLYAMNLNSDDSISSVPVTFDDDGRLTSENYSDSLIWSTATGIGFSNKEYGKWLTSSLVSADNASAEKNYSDNLYVSDTPYENDEFSSFIYKSQRMPGNNPNNDFYNQIKNEADMYLGFGDLYNDVAHPDDVYLQVGSYAALKSDGSSTIYTSSEVDWSMEFDFAFGDENSWLEIFRDDDLNNSLSGTHVSTDFGLKIEPGMISVYRPAYQDGPNDIYGQVYEVDGISNVDNKSVIATAQFGTNEEGGTHTYGFTHWHRFKVDYTDEVLRVYVDGKEIIKLDNYPISRQRLFFFNTPNQCVGMDNLFVKAAHCYDRSQVQGVVDWFYYAPNEEMVYIREDFNNMSVNNNAATGAGSGSEWDLYGSAQAIKITDDDHYHGEQETKLEENVFYANEDNYNEVFIYEKKLVSEMSTIYQLANGLEGGESYVLVNSNVASENTGDSLLLRADNGERESVTVYEDGVSISPAMATYLPYIDLFEIGGTRNFYDNSEGTGSYKFEYGSSYEFFATETEGGFFLNYVPVDLQQNQPTAGHFIAKDGSRPTTPSENTVITVVDGKVTIGGAEYYVYKKVVVPKIDTEYTSDMAVVDFGFGFELSDTFFRDNDPWTGRKDSVDVTLTGIAVNINAEKNDKFYPAGTRVGGAGTTAALTEGTATYQGNTFSFTNNGAYDKILTVDYEGKVDHLGAYMYSTLHIIPATSVYYEDSLEGNFITYSNSSAAHDGYGTWSAVKNGTDPVIDVLDGQYGKSSAYSNYLNFSGNSVHKVMVDAATGGDVSVMPTASFTFTGTGFDVVSAVGRTTCIVFVKVIDKNTDKQVKYFMVDNYFGYTYDSEADKWTPVTGEGAPEGVQLYQVPVISWSSEAHSTYEVTISVTYDERFDHGNVGYSEFFFDGVRVYNTLNLDDEDNAVAVEKYKADKELIISDVNLRKLLITNGVADSTTLTGAMFIDGNGLTNETDAFATYKEVGAKNEITIPSGKGISFSISADSIPEKVSLGVKASTSAAGSITVSGGGEKNATVSVATATDMYYDVTEAINWNNGEATITIVNNGTASVSLTRLRLTTGTEEIATVEYFVDATTERIAYRTLASTFGVNGEEFMVGDVKQSQDINSADSLTIKKYLAGVKEFDNREYAAADINGDGEVDAKDVMLLKKLLRS
ncbi:MAG: hypothetical protein E7660_05910 [Ruminococcaceae bacterium]|nr:hypothetical protein [Oscillospiraceae bacterium]